MDSVKSAPFTWKPRSAELQQVPTRTTSWHRELVAVRTANSLSLVIENGTVRGNALLLEVVLEQVIRIENLGIVDEFQRRICGEE